MSNTQTQKNPGQGNKSQQQPSQQGKAGQPSGTQGQKPTQGHSSYERDNKTSGNK